MSGEFLNPYNFIPLPKMKTKAYEKDEQKHTGVIEYKITTRSPLFIPNTSSNESFVCDVEQHESYDFFSYTELDSGKKYDNEYFEPVIPGSELRGMIRSVYEILTDSCMGVLNEAIHPIMRISEMYKAGLLKRENSSTYSLVEAEDCIYRKEINTRTKEKKAYVKLYEEEKLPEGSKVYFEKIQRSQKCKSLVKGVSEEKYTNHLTEGYLIKGMSDGSIGKKHNCHVFIPNEKRKKNLTVHDVERLKTVLQAYASETNAEDSYEEYREQLEIFLHGKGNDYFPVYYSEIANGDKTYLYLSPACFTKELAVHSLKELAGEFTTCKTEKEKCPCCDLFGMLGENHEQACASKIRFADAKIESKKSMQEYYDKIVTLETLSFPRLNNVEFYLQRPEGADFWNYDYYVKAGKIIPAKGVLRGRKYYWHQNGKKLKLNVEKNSMNKTVRPVKCGNSFCGKVYFDGISNKQLKQLIWILNGGNDDEQPQTGRLAYKLGMGKPLGLGSVELKVTKVSERLISIKDDSICYEIKDCFPELSDIPFYEDVEFSSVVKEDFFTIASLDAAKGKMVTYPIVDDLGAKEQQEQAVTEGFKWYVNNHIGYDYIKKRRVDMPQKRTQMKRQFNLPPIKGVQTLPMEFGATEQKYRKYNEDMQASNKKQYEQRKGYQQKQENCDKIFQKGTVIKCKITSRIMENESREGYFAFVTYNGYKGKIYGVPMTLQKGDFVELEIVGENVNGFRGNFVKVL